MRAVAVGAFLFLASLGGTLVRMVPSETTFVPASRQPPSKKIALIVAIGTYEKSTGWNPLASANDARVVRDTLLRQGFASDDIVVVSETGATATGIVGAFRTTLIERATREPIATALFHYSGHGHRLTDDNGDEPDGYDEVLVPVDAPKRPKLPYNGSKHVRDDQLRELILELRRAVGAGGEVIVSLDSCYSGSGARAAMAAAEVRGDLTPIGQPQDGRNGIDAGSGFDAEVGGNTAALAPYVVLSAAGHDELAWETLTPDNQAMGSLSLALSQAFARVSAQTTYRALFHDLKRTMAALVINSPQLEGSADRQVLGGRAVTQEPFYTIASYDAVKRIARLRSGTLAGLFDGARVAVHTPGTLKPDANATLATGIVENARLSTADLQLDTLTDAGSIPNGWVFVTEPSFGTLSTVVKIDAADTAPWRRDVEGALRQRRFVTIGTATPEFIVAEQPGSGAPTLFAAADGRALLGPPYGTGVDIAEAIARRVKDATHNRYLRGVSTRAQGVDVAFDLTPCELTCRAQGAGERCECTRDIARNTSGEGADVTLALGDGFRIRLRNRGVPVFVSILELEAPGSISLVWPGFGDEDDANKLAASADFTIPPRRITPPSGLEVFKLFASRNQIDFRPVTTRGMPRSSSRGILDHLFLDAFEGARASPTLPADSVFTRDLTVKIVDRRVP